MEDLILRLAENKCNGNEEEEIGILKKGANSVIARNTLYSGSPWLLIT